MGMTQAYVPVEPARPEIDRLGGPVVVEFGAPWCGHCQSAQPLIAEAFKEHERVVHYKIEDGRGRPLGRSFGVKLWPTLVFMKDGKEVARLVRPTGAKAIEDAFERIDPTP